MGMDVLRCKSVAGVNKEVAAFLLVYNLVRAIVCEAARGGKRSTRPAGPRQLRRRAVLGAPRPGRRGPAAAAPEPAPSVARRATRDQAAPQELYTVEPAAGPATPSAARHGG
jgi:hypothetical protein